MNIRQTLFFAAHRLVGKRRGDWYVTYRREDRRGVSPDTTRQMLISLLAHAARSVPYYAELMAQRGDAYKDAPEAYLAQLPILTKDMIHQHFDQLKSNDLARRRWIYNRSSGSTGEPVRVIQDQDFLDRQMGMQDLSYAWAGREFGEPTFFLWGSTRDLLQGSESLHMRLLNRLANYTSLNAFRMTPAQMRVYLDLINAKHPRLIVAYAQAIYSLAQFAEEAGIAVIPQTAILTSANVLHPYMREKIEGVFGCKVFDRYGCREAGDIASECEYHTGLHVFPWGSYVEVVDDEGRAVPPGEDGNILITSLQNYAMPLIRYKIEDRAILAAEAKCPCGRKGQFLVQVTGRALDNFRTRSGRIIPGAFFSHLIGVDAKAGAVKQFQAVQEDYDHVRLRLVKRREDDSVDLAPIRAAIEKAMGAGIQLDVEYVQEITPGPSGKYRYTISHVQP